MINIFRLGQISRIKFEPALVHNKNNELKFLYTDKGVVSYDTYNNEKENVNLYTKKQKPENKKKFYKRVVRHFIGQILGDIDYDAIDRDVPLKPIRF